VENDNLHVVVIKLHVIAVTTSVDCEQEKHTTKNTHQALQVYNLVITHHGLMVLQECGLKQSS
jgi:hypothetical protein